MSYYELDLIEEGEEGLDEFDEMLTDDEKACFLADCETEYMEPDEKQIMRTLWGIDDIGETEKMYRELEEKYPADYLNKYHV